MKGRWQSMVGAALVAVLIWFFAEGRSLITVTRSGAIALVAPDQSKRVVWRLPDGEREFEIELTLTGSTAALDELARELQSPVILQPGVELPSDLSDHLVNLAEALRASEVFASRGIEIGSVEPAQVRIRIDELVEREVRVTPVVEGAELVGPPLAAPDTVTVTLPGGLADQLITPGATVGARVGPESLAQRSGQTTVSGVRVIPPAAWAGARRLTVSPQIVDVTFTLEDTIRELLLTQAPVYVALPAGQQANWVVEIPVDQQYLRDVTVRGPSEIIAQIEAGQIPVVAMVKLTPEDLVAGAGAREATFNDWTGSVEFSAPSLRVEYELRPVASPETGGGEGEE